MRAKKPKQLKKSDLLFIESAIRKWLALPEAQGFGKVQKASMAEPWAKGPRVDIELNTITAGEYDRLLFYFEKKVLGFRVVGVWTVKPREQIWTSQVKTGPMRKDPGSLEY